MRTRAVGPDAPPGVVVTVSPAATPPPTASGTSGANGTALTVSLRALPAGSCTRTSYAYWTPLSTRPSHEAGGTAVHDRRRLLRAGADHFGLRVRSGAPQQGDLAVAGHRVHRGGGRRGGVVVDREGAAGGVPRYVGAASVYEHARAFGAAEHGRAAGGDPRYRVGAAEGETDRVVEPAVVVRGPVGLHPVHRRCGPVDAEPDGIRGRRSRRPIGRCTSAGPCPRKRTSRSDSRR